MSHAWPIVGALVLILGGGLVHGIWSARWDNSQDLEFAVERLKNLPQEFGPTTNHWKVLEDTKLDDKVLEQAGMQGYKSLRYERNPGEEILVLLACGRPGPIERHTPDVCFPTSGYEEVGKKERVKIDTPAGAAEFETALFRQGNMAVPNQIRVYWTFSPTGTWRVAEIPRFDFCRFKFLYKLYVTRNLGAASLDSDGKPGTSPGSPGQPKEKEKESSSDRVCLDFIRALLPELQNALFPQ
jgi:hypothetical protein